MNRTVRIFALYRNACDGVHFAVVKSGSWAEVIPYLNWVTCFAGPRCLFLQQTDGSLSPLMA